MDEMGSACTQHHMVLGLGDMSVLSWSKKQMGHGSRVR